MNEPHGQITGCRMVFIKEIYIRSYGNTMFCNKFSELNWSSVEITNKEFNNKYYFFLFSNYKGFIFTFQNRTKSTLTL